MVRTHANHRRATLLAALGLLAALAGTSCGSAGTYRPPNPCADGIKNNAETDVDCGGSCAACGTGRGCGGGRDCDSGICIASQCVSEHCGNMQQDGDETDKDCGGALCAGCFLGQSCRLGEDCQSGTCDAGVCKSALQISPRRGPASGGTEIVVTGESFQSGPGVALLIGQAAAGSLLVVAPTVLTATTGPSSTAGEMDVLLTMPGDRKIHAARAFSYALGTVEFDPAVTMAGPYEGASVAATDLNADGKPDLVLAGGGLGQRGQIEVLIGNGDGTFAAPRAYSGVPGSSRIAIGDYNRDGRPDVAVGSTTATSIAVLPGIGDGTLGEPGRAETAFPGQDGLVMVDLNGDRRPDLVAAHAQSSALSVLLGKGDGAFQPATAVKGLVGPTSLAAGDWNRDGKPDLVVAGPSGPAVRVLLGKGDGTLGTGTNYDAPMNVAALTTGDFDADGKADLAVTGTGAGPLSLFFGNGDGTFRAALNTGSPDQRPALLAADLDLDGLADLAFLALERGAEKDRAGVLRAVGDGSFRPATSGALGGRPSDLAVADVNRDGKLDLISTGPFGVSVLLNRGK